MLFLLQRFVFINHISTLHHLVELEKVKFKKTDNTFSLCKNIINKSHSLLGFYLILIDSNDNFFYLGICKRIDMHSISITSHTINNHKVYQVSGAVRGTHAIAFSKNGIKQFNQFIKHFSIVAYDMLIELYTLSHPANIVRCDLSSQINGHLGLFFQDREKFKSSLYEHYYDV